MQSPSTDFRPDLDGGAMNDPSARHPLQAQLRAFLLGRLEEPQAEQIERHVADCETCCDRLTELHREGDPFLSLLRSPAEDEAESEPSSEEDEEPPPPAASPEGAGQSIGPYRLAKVLGEGGMGIVYQAEQQRPVRRSVALKVIKPGMDSRQVVARFEAERQALALMDHHSIPRVLDAGTTPAGRPYFVTELISGAPITEYCDRRGLGLRGRLELFVAVCQAVQHAHQKGVLHRDLKPSNVLVAHSEGRPIPKVIDFGVAKALEDPLTERTVETRCGQIVGTLEYMSPEQAALGASDVDTRSDIYSLGALLYELLTGAPPLERERAGDALEALLRRVREQDPPPPSKRLSRCERARRAAAARLRIEPKRLIARLRGDLDAIVMKAMEKDRVRRYATAAELAADVRRYLNDEPVEARPPSAAYRLGKAARRHRNLLAAGAVFAVLLVAGTTVSVWQAVRATRANALAAHEARRARQAQADEVRQRLRAQRLAEQSQRRLVQLYLATGNHAADQGDWRSALLWYARAWRFDQERGADDAPHRQRMAAVIHSLPQLEGVCFHAGQVMEAVFDPAGPRVLTRTDDNRAFLWDPFRSERLLSPLACEGRMLHAAFSPDGGAIAAGDSQGTVRLWNSRDGKLQTPPLPHPAAVNWVAFSPDSRMLATACDDGLVRFFRAADGAPAGPSIDCGSAALFVGFSPDGTTLATAAADEFARAWRPEDGRPQCAPLPHRMHPGNPADDLRQPPLFGDDGRLLIAASHREIYVCDLEASPQAARRIEVPFELNSLSHTPDGKILLATGRSSRSVVVDLATGQAADLQHSREVQRGGVSPDGRRAVTASSSGTLHFWDLTSGEETLPNVYHAANVVCLRYRRDGKYVLTGGRDGTARVWRVDVPPFASEPYDYACGAAHRLSEAAGEAAALSPDGNWEIHWEGEQARITRRGEAGQKPIVLEHGEAIDRAAFAASGTCVLTWGRARVQVWDARTGRMLGKPWPLPAPLTDLRASRDGRRLAAVDETERGFAWDVAAGRLIAGPIEVRELPPRAAIETTFAEGVSDWAGGFRACAVSDDGRRLALRAKKFVEVHDLDAGASVLLDLGSGNVSAAAFDPSGARIVVAGSNKTARVWDAVTGEPIGPPLHHSHMVRLADFGPQGRRVVTLASDGRVRVWQGASGELLIPPFPTFTPRPSRVWYNRDGTRLIAATAQGAARQWRLPALDVSPAAIGRIVELLTGQRIDETDGVVRLSPGVFRQDLEAYRDAWASLRLD